MRHLVTSFENVGNGRTGFPFTCVTESIVRAIKRETYTTWYDSPELMESIFDLFVTQIARSHATRIVSEKTGVRTLALGRACVDPAWTPSKGRFSGSG
jgi:hypothetical protein